MSDRKRIFVSFSKLDQDITLKLCNELEKHGCDCWIFTRDIAPGEEFTGAIVNAIKKSIGLVLVFSENANQSKHVKREINLAVKNNIPIVPIRIDNAELSDSLDYLIGINQWLDASDPPFENHFPAIISVMSKLIKPSVKTGEVISNMQSPDRKAGPGEFLLQPTFWNHFEDNVEYIKIPGGTYKFSVTGKMETVPDLFFCKYLVTNKRYRKFITYLEGKEKALEEILPLKVFAKELLELAGTIKDYPRYLGTNPLEWGKKLRSSYDDDKEFNGDDQPVVRVTWYSARTYCFWLSCLHRQKTVYRLPTEMEWEWAASGREPDGSLREYPWAKDKGEPSPKLANYGGNVGATIPVGRYPEGATPEGLMDMAGNAWEWMDNWYNEDEIGRVLRGGSWGNHSGLLRCTARNRDNPWLSWYSYGFRVVCVCAPSHTS